MDVNELAEELEDKAQLGDRSKSLGFAEAENEPIIEGGDDEDPLKGAVKSFEALNLEESLLKGVYAYKYRVPSKIQSVAIPAILMKPTKNLIAQAQSGTGKTGAFSLGMLASVDPEKKWPQAICLSPTRELCRQTFDVVAALGKYTKVRPLLVVPEADIPKQITDHHILVATPGKLESLVNKRYFDIRKITIFVLDEADEMLGIQGHENIAVKLNKKLSPTCQRCLFSATYSDRVSQFAHQFVPQPRKSILIPPEKLTLAKLYQYYIPCGTEDNKFKVLDNIFRSFSVGQSIIFVTTRATADALAGRMRAATHEVSVLYGKDMKESERDRVMDAFRVGTARILITTNVLARGVDVSQVTMVINYDLPAFYAEKGAPDCETYLHRIGRSARFGASGVAINLIHDQTTFGMIKKIESHFGRAITEVKPDELEVISKKLEEFQ